MNYATEVVDAAPPSGLALVELRRDGRRRTWTFGEVSARTAAFAGALAQRGVGRGDVVMTVVGNRSEWVFAMVACFRIGAVALPCSEQLRDADLRVRIAATEPKVIVVDERNAAVVAAAFRGCPLVTVPDDRLFRAEPAPAVQLAGDDPALVMFTSGTSGEPKAVVHAQRYLRGQALQTDAWLGVQADDRVWCTTATGWSKSTRNAFIAPWLRGATAVIHDARFDPHERLELVERERVTLLCMSPTEYRVIAKRADLPRFPRLRGMVSAGEALGTETFDAWRESTGLAIRDGYGQTETGHLTANRAGEPARPGSMGRPLPGVSAWIEDDQLVVDPATVPTFFAGYLGEPPAPTELWRTGDRVTEDEDGYLYFVGRADDVIISAGYRIGPAEVESALCGHPAVVDAAVVAAPDDERGSVVRAVVVLRDGVTAGPETAEELQQHVKATTAPYKYPRVVDFVPELPRTHSGKLRRALLRNG